MYEVRSTITFPGSRVSDFAGNLRAQKLNKAQIKREILIAPLVSTVRAIFLQNPKPENPGKLSWNAPHTLHWCDGVELWASVFFVLHAMVFCVYIATEIFIKI